MDSKGLWLLLSLVQFVHVSYQLPTPAVKDVKTNGDKDPQQNGTTLDMIFTSNDMRRPLGRNGVPEPNKRWPSGIIPFTIDSSFTNAQRNAISEAMKDFARYTCVKFVPHTDQPNHVRIIKSGTGCWSYIGRIEQWSYQQLSLDDGCVRDKYIAIHELNHAVGFGHEQDRPDRDDFLTIVWENVNPADKLEKQNWMKSFGVGYDCYSAMHYGPTSFSRNGQTTFICKASPNRPVGSGQGGLSRKDIEKIRRMYQCNGKTAGF